MSAPLAIRASFLLSGMLGLQVQIPDGNGRMQTINQTVPFSVSNSFEPSIHIENSNRDNLGQSVDKFPLLGSKSARSNNEGNQLLETSNNFGMKINVDQRCGSRYCDSSETCVSWKHETDTRRPEYRECHKANGEDHAKTNPRNNSLCPNGMTHSIVSEPSECPSCGLTWKYKCVPTSESPHSCQLKKCRKGFLCFEQIHCNIQSPCYTQAVCEDDSQVYVNHN